MQKIHKALMQVKLADYSGAGYFRCLQIIQHIGHKYMSYICPTMSPVYNGDPGLLSASSCIYIQRDFSELGNQFMHHVKNLKATQPEHFTAKLVYELDDYIFGKNETHEGGDIMEAVPSYSNLHTNIQPGVQDHWCIENMKIADDVTVTTDFLAREVRKLVGHQRVRVIPISISLRDFGRRDSMREIQGDLKKPTVIYCGAPCHYGNKENQMLGDFDYGWVEWIKKNVNDGRIHFLIMGGCPWFLEDIAEKIQIVPGICIDQYIPFIRNSCVDFVIAPLCKNKFNMAKSDLKLLEATNLNAVLLGSYFNDEQDIISQGPYAKLKYGKIPYKASAEKIDEAFWDLCKKPAFMEALVTNKNTCNTRWTECPEIENEWLKAFGIRVEDFITGN